MNYSCYACPEIPHKLEVYATVKREKLLEIVLRVIYNSDSIKIFA